MKASYFRSLAFGYHSPIGSADPAGAVLWLKVTPTRRLRVLAEYTFSQIVEADIWAAIEHQDRKLHRGRSGFTIGYTVSSPELFAKKSTHYPGMLGQTIAETFGALGLWLIPADEDEVNGWQRLQNWLRSDAKGEPMLTIDPSCLGLIKHLKSGLSKDTAPDTLATTLPTLAALRFGVMSRPAPLSAEQARVIPDGSPAYYMQKQREGSGIRKFGHVR